MNTTQIRVAGFGGQGVILSAMIIGKAASIFQNGYATLTQNFGPEARGSACSAQVILSERPILYPYVTRPDVLIVMSQDAYHRFAPELRGGSVLLVEQDLVQISHLPAGVRAYSVPATRIAEDLGKRMVVNVVMVGFFGAITGILERDALRSAVADSAPAGTEELNLRAYDQGYEHGLSCAQPVATGLEPSCLEIE